MSYKYCYPSSFILLLEKALDLHKVVPSGNILCLSLSLDFVYLILELHPHLLPTKLFLYFYASPFFLITLQCMLKELN
jgi:hypothetical protein